MRLYLVRHAIAEDAAAYEDDSLRPLTKKGRGRMNKIAAALREIGVQPDLIVSSPYVRASQTAVILAGALNYREEIVYTDLLMPMGDADDMIGEINEKYQADELMLVGHEPSMSSLAGVLLTGKADIAINFKKGGVCCLSVNNLHFERKAVLEWLLTPKIAVKVY